jgi:hypothetical protein
VNEVHVPPGSTRILKQNDEVRFGTLVRFKFLLRTLSEKATQISLTDISLAGVTKWQDIDKPQNDIPLGQPVLNQDGSLQLPGAASPIPASVVDNLKEMPALVVLTGNISRDGTRPPQVFMLRQGKHTTLGRDKSNDIDLADVVASRQHAEIFSSPDGFYIRDLGSSNGVTVNQTRIDNPYLLAHGDRITIGSSNIYFIDLHAGWRATERVPTQQPLRVEQAVAVGAAPSARPAWARDKLVSSPVGARAGRLPDHEGARSPQIKICRQCGVANTHIARFCAGCSAPL